MGYFLIGGLLVALSTAFATFAFQVDVRAVNECPSAPSNPQDRREDKTTLSIVSWNVEWLFLGGVGSSNCPGSGCAWATDQEASSHFDAVSAIIAELDADILTLLEVNDCDILQRLVESPALAGKGYKPYLRKGTDTYTNQNVGFLTRIDPISDVQRSKQTVSYPVAGETCGYSAQGSKGCSKHAYATFQVTGMDKPLILVGAHLLAFPDDRKRCLEREAQACVIRNIVVNEATGKEVVILGDLNDFSASVPDAQGSKPISRVLEILSNPGLNLCDGSMTRNDSGPLMEQHIELHQLAANIHTHSNRYSAWWDKNKNCQEAPDELSMIDHMLLSPGLASKVLRSEISHLWSPSCGLYSDHWPLFLEVETR